MIFRSIDIGDYRINCRVRILRQVPTIATHGMETVDCFAGLKEMCVMLRDISSQTRSIRTKDFIHIRQTRNNDAHVFRTTTTDVRFT